MVKTMLFIDDSASDRNEQRQSGLRQRLDGKTFSAAAMAVGTGATEPVLKARSRQ